MNVRYAVGCLLAAGLAVASTSCSNREVIDLQGAGATFPAPLYKRWFLEYYRAHPDTQVSYQAIGSGAGVRQFSEGLVDFGASDSAMTDQEMAEVKSGVLLLPVTAGSIVLAYNVTGVNKPLQLSRDTYSRIFLGEITRWNHEAVRNDNPGVELPVEDITIIWRQEGSGTTFAFTNHLSAISPTWKKGPGTGKSVIWPTGVGARGNSGVTALIQQTPGAIGYLEYGYAELGKLPMAVLQNKAGNYVAPTPEAGKAALAGAAMPENLRLFIPDPEGPEAYPVVTYTWVLCYQHYADAQKAHTLKSILRYCLTDGQNIAGDLGYIPLPEAVSTRVLAAMERIEP